jgi:hypothetical protein
MTNLIFVELFAQLSLFCEKSAFNGGHAESRVQENEKTSAHSTYQLENILINTLKRDDHIDQVIMPFYLYF